jgi:[ribosomal protein S5]-alanine N-acetyltransferase
MRFSLGPYTREQTQSVLQKFLSWNQAGLPSQFAVIFRGNNELIGYCGFLHWHLNGADEVEIGYRLDPDYLEPRACERGRPGCPRSRFP